MKQKDEHQDLVVGLCNAGEAELAHGLHKFTRTKMVMIGGWFMKIVLPVSYPN